jgi:O-antigen/teichoic acid export membrane protein
MTKPTLTGKLINFISQSRFILVYSVVERVFFFLFFLLLANRFEVAEYGTIVTAFAIANMFALMFDLGIPIHIQKEISSGKEASGLFGSVAMLDLMLLPAFAIATIATGMFLYDMTFSFILLICIPVFFFSLSNILNKTLAGFNDYRSQLTALLVSRLPVFAVILLLFLNGYSDKFTYLALLLISAIIQLIVLTSKLMRDVRLSKQHLWKLSSLKDLYPVIPLGAAVVFNFLYDKIDILLISKMLGFTESGLYNIAYGLFKTAAMSFSFLLIPALTKISYFSRRRSAVRLLLARYTWLIFLICAAASIVIFLSADYLIMFLYGDKYMESASLLRVLALALVGLGLNNLFGVALNGLGLYKENFYVTLAGLIVNVTINLLLIPRMGIMGAVIATIATEYLVLALDSYFINSYLKEN